MLSYIGVSYDPLKAPGVCTAASAQTQVQLGTAGNNIHVPIDSWVRVESKQPVFSGTKLYSTVSVCSPHPQSTSMTPHSLLDSTRGGGGVPGKDTA